MIMYCEKCREYTLEKKCAKCCSETINKKPGKFNPNKDYSKERLKVRGYL
ncbi:ribosome biogenesis protein [archaeon CG_4_10_14_0_2_um_filter_Archaea_38_6]|nr:MAG: ribosome biogenesis protein [archaeon CG07_land_8_20_14_0_80_38_8]PIU88351.1 MAG: ribosome biogenesis protein [archaeon CG06_land_8_20_14_3_00_37_11]PIX43529.1 MAG: ribosome biogenesis protein [archaeon CG_4_8_14_3_um_filter_38_5]PJA22567.1 MAG: ribosome biogenesis protein [archaeon CG_4_10_14_0_2_um_filter_Archaea_38_6]